MNNSSRLGTLPRRALATTACLVFSTVALVTLSGEARGQTVVVADFSGAKNVKALSKRARGEVAKALSNQGARIITYRQYLQQAKKNRIAPRRALTANSIKVLSSKLKLDGVITGSVKKQGRTFLVTVNAHGANGRVLAKKNYRLKKPAFPSSIAGAFAGMVAEKLGGRAAVSAAPVKPPPVEPEPAPEEDSDTGGGDAFLPPWARAEKQEEPATGSGGADAYASPAATPEVATPAPPVTRSKKWKAGAVPEILFAAGLSMSKRGGLSPRHESGLFPGLLVNGHFFLGAFLDTIVVRDIGFAGSYNMSLGLKYEIKDVETWDSSQSQWSGEFLYRFSLKEVALRPAFMLRAGYGSTTCTIDTENPSAKSAAYSYPYAALDVHLMLYPPILRLNLSGGYLFSVSLSEDIKGDGSGFALRAGVDLDLFENLHFGLGWEMLQFKLEEETVGNTSDMYHRFYARLGWNYK